MRDFDDNEFPLAYLITFRCYGTWLHGDPRGSYRRNSNIIEGVVHIPPRYRLVKAEQEQLKHGSVRLSRTQGLVVEQAVREVCLHRKYMLRAINVRTNHVHTFVSAMRGPEPILGAFKSYATRALRLTGSISADITPWSRHGSTIYLWKENDVAKAVEYVALGQDYPSQ